MSPRGTYPILTTAGCVCFETFIRCVRAPQNMCGGQETTFVELALDFHHVPPGDQTWITCQAWWQASSTSEPSPQSSHFLFLKSGLLHVHQKLPCTSLISYPPTSPPTPPPHRKPPCFRWCELGFGDHSSSQSLPQMHQRLNYFPLSFKVNWDRK